MFIADGVEGLPPHIPPNSSLSFDLTLLGFRERTPWVKPLIQDNSTNEKPYHADLKVYMDMVLAGGLVEGGVFDGVSENDSLGPMSGAVSVTNSVPTNNPLGTLKKTNTSLTMRNSINRP